MGKKKIALLVFVTVVAVLIYLGYGIVSKTQEKQLVENRLQTVPPFELTSLGKGVFSNEDLKPGLNTIFIYFNSECDYCQHEAESIRDNLSKFKGTQFAFVSNETLQAIERFAEQYGLKDQPRVNFLYDQDSRFSSQVDVPSIPYLLIYDEQGSLIKRHKGQLNAEGLLKLLKQ